MYCAIICMYCVAQCDAGTREIIHRCSARGRDTTRSILHRENLMRHHYHKIMVSRGVMMDYENIGTINLRDTRCLYTRTLLFVHRQASVYRSAFSTAEKHFRVCWRTIHYLILFCKLDYRQLLFSLLLHIFTSYQNSLQIEYFIKIYV